ncbi:MAG: DUF2917 domain-containing protein [Alphaproteobacteria bacterium]|nr:DUF2917 domain-containing protein [Alphaproteobacteria bacterium]
MIITAETRTETLAKGAAVRFQDAAGTLVTCLSGGLWITQEDDGRDIVLAPGQGAVLDRGGRTVIGALAESRYLVQRLPAPAGRSPRPIHDDRRHSAAPLEHAS